jgi:hypothetical protein
MLNSEEGLIWTVTNVFLLTPTIWAIRTTLSHQSLWINSSSLFYSTLVSVEPTHVCELSSSVLCFPRPVRRQVCGRGIGGRTEKGMPSLGSLQEGHASFLYGQLACLTLILWHAGDSAQDGDRVLDRVVWLMGRPTQYLGFLRWVLYSAYMLTQEVRMSFTFPASWFMEL